MLTIRRIHRPAIAGLLTGALLAFAASGATIAQANDVTQRATAQERYYSSYGKPQPIDPGTAVAIAQERYYSSYGTQESLTPPSSAAPSDDTPWVRVALSVTVALLLVTASATLIRRRYTRRIRRARAAT